MSIQTTRYITREEAEKKAYKILIQQGFFDPMNNKELEEYIDEEFYNYTIITEDNKKNM